MKVIVLTFKSLCNWRLFFFSPAEPHWEGKKKNGRKKNRKNNTKKASPAQLLQSGKAGGWQGGISFGCCRVLLMLCQSRETRYREMEEN